MSRALEGGICRRDQLTKQASFERPLSIIVRQHDVLGSFFFFFFVRQMMPERGDVHFETRQADEPGIM